MAPRLHNPFSVTVFVLPAVFVALAIVAVTARRRRIVVPKAAPAARLMTPPPAPSPEPAATKLANGTPPATVIPLALRDDRNLVATPAVVIGLQRLRRGNAPRASSSGEIDSEPTREREDDTLPTIIVDEN